MIHKNKIKKPDETRHNTSNAVFHEKPKIALSETILHKMATESDLDNAQRN